MAGGTYPIASRTLQRGGDPALPESARGTLDRRGGLAFRLSRGGQDLVSDAVSGVVDVTQPVFLVDVDRDADDAPRHAALFKPVSYGSWIGLAVKHNNETALVPRRSIYNPSVQPRVNL